MSNYISVGRGVGPIAIFQSKHYAIAFPLEVSSDCLSQSLITNVFVIVPPFVASN